ncbi:hypothetical protein RHSIM_Rhsim06G0180000 [Rhododendron simsii]|uniref:Protein kinase domain-containing protein n=1 Tax=Rhododendron simsii TaxID=118357 RepID=A0A834GRN3_RHOSS|nr:hypothetical protein RHSIM_Rhsim06G0180000 [Rhododendron simsii]
MEELQIGGSSTTKNKMVIFLFCSFFFFPAGVGAGAHDHDDACMPKRCADEGPEIRFPFWLKDIQPDRCGYGPDFALTCSHNNETLLDNPFYSKVVVQNINYSAQQFDYEFTGCVPHQENSSLIFNTSLSLTGGYNYGTDLCEYHIFSCPSPSEYPYDSYDPYRYAQIYGCVGSPKTYTLVLDSQDLIWGLLVNCTKTYTFQSVPCNTLPFFPYPQGRQYWSRPNCGECETEGKYCRLSSSNNGKQHETECFDIPNQPTGTSHHLIIQKKKEECETKSPPNVTTGELSFFIQGETKSPPNVTGELSFFIQGEIKNPFDVTDLYPPGLFLLVELVIAAYFVHRVIILKKEDLRVEIFLENYRALKPTRYTYAEIKKITQNLKDELGQGGYGTVYKGKLSNDVPIAAKILNNFTGNGEDFINEVGTIGMIHHVNVVRLVGYCADGYKKALVYEYLPHDLEKFISSEHKKASLGWEKLQDIALGISKGIEYLHQGCDQRIVHFDIKPHNILLDKNFIPKISDFGLAKLCSKEKSVVSMTAARGTVGYIAPEVFSRNFGNVSHKSDVYSFGMLLLEMVGGRKKNFDVHAEENSEEVYFPEWIYNRLNREEVNNNEIVEGGDAKIVKKLTVVGLWCIQWYPGDRPSMKAVVQMLEGDGETLAMPPNPFSTTSRSITRGNMGGRHFSSMLEIISESD